MNRVDAHHHIWDISTRIQPWMSAPGYEPMARSFTAADHAALAAAAGIDASVVVQCVAEEAETLELLAVADADAVIAAVVGWVDLTAPDVADRIAALREATGGHRLRGIRHQVHDEPDPDWLRRPDVQRGIRAVGEAGMAYDLLLKLPQMPAAIATVAELEQVTFVVDHAAKPLIASGAREPWASRVRSLAEHDNVTCKLSGLTTEASWRSWMLDDLQPYVDVVFESFGSDRVMAGSDWPVCTLAATYDAAQRLADRFTDHLSPAERAAVLAGTAQRVYRLDPPAVLTHRPDPPS